MWSSVKAIEPLRYHGNEVIVFHILDPQELNPKFKDPVLLQDLEHQHSFEVSPDYAKNEYRAKINEHIRVLAEKVRAAGLEYVFMDSSRPLDEGLREYLNLRQRRK